MATLPTHNITVADTCEKDGKTVKFNKTIGAAWEKKTKLGTVTTLKMNDGTTYTLFPKTKK